MSIRIPTAGDFEQYKKLQINCFPDIVDRSEDFWEQVKKSVKWDYGLVYELDGEIVSSYMIHDFKMYVRGRLMSVGGIYGVATYPEHRRKGYVKELIVESLIRMRQRGQYLSALNPFKFEYYRKYGYEIGALNWVVESDPNNIVIPDGFKPLTLKGFSKVESYEAMKEVRHKVGKLYNFIMLETYPEWRFHKFWDRDKLFAAMDGETVAGYIISRVEEHGNEYVLRILDLVARNERARLTLLDYVKKHGDQVKKFKWFSLGDEPLTDYFYENWEDQVKTQVYGSVMFRVVDVWKALEKLVYPQGHAEFTLRVIDTYAPWNQVPIRVEVSNGKAKVYRSEDEDYDLVIDVKAFSQLYVGYRSLEQLIDIGKAVVNENKIKAISTIFPRRKTRVIIDF